MCPLTDFKNIIKEFEDRPNIYIFAHLGDIFSEHSKDEEALVKSMKNTLDIRLRFLMSYLEKDRGLDLPTVAREIIKIKREKNLMSSISKVI